MKQLASLCRLPPAHIESTSLPDNGLGYEKADCAIDRALTATVELVVGVLCLDLVAEEPRRPRGGVGDQRF
jgi:hypothetical protein